MRKDPVIRICNKLKKNKTQADAPLSLVRGRHRLRLLIKAPRGYDLSAYVREWLTEGPKPKGSLKLDIDIDPQSFL